MSRKTVRLTMDNLDGLPDPCRACLFWQLDPVRRNRLDNDDSRSVKETWVSHALRDWGSCGQVALADDVPVGYAIYVPPSFADGAATFPTAPVSEDALLLTTVYVDPAARGGGVGRLLIQGMARDLVKRGGGAWAVEAFGETDLLRPGLRAAQGRGRCQIDRRPAGGCVVPAGFLSAVGFKTQRAHPTNPRMRMELRSALTWKDEVEQAVERLLVVVRPTRPAPKPAQPGLPPARSRIS
ncbi:MAG: GNAT family N-acetyltransferase [Nocardioides sp.]|nr:GNAT family N-acetyltransferase [Nocardioides sp.]